MSLETYVKLLSKYNTAKIPTYCPIHLETGSITIGLSLVGFFPKGAKVLGSYNIETGKLNLYKSLNRNNVTKGEKK
jgi:hypothetical protein